MVRWITIKILENLKKEIYPIIESGKFHSISEFVSHATRNELKKQRGNSNETM
jgi:Arc/MetJ-type ribon-helix-helix transcriptional regulator